MFQKMFLQEWDKDTFVGDRQTRKLFEDKGPILIEPRACVILEPIIQTEKEKAQAESVRQERDTIARDLFNKVCSDLGVPAHILKGSSDGD